MSEFIFVEKDIQPDNEMLKDALGRSFTHFEKLQDLTKHLIQEWKFYGKKYGWQFKVSEKKKAVCYVVPYEKYFLAGMALREADRNLLLDSKLDPQVKEELAKAEKIMEGYPLSFNIRTKADFKKLITVLEILGKLN